MKAAQEIEEQVRVQVRRDRVSYENEMDAVKAKTMEETDRKCPQCGATMDFDPSTGGLYCPYCDYREEIKVENETGDKYAKELDFESAEYTGNCDWGAAKKTVTCKSCGAVTVYDALEVASECPYCGSNQVMEASDVKTLAPNGVIPFAVTEKTAGEKFISWLSKKWFAPKEAKLSAKAEAFKGVYLPFWTFDADTSSDYTGEYGIDKKVKRGEKEEIVTDWHSVRGHYNHHIDDELVEGTNTQNANTLRKIQPYDTNKAVVYKPEYLAGFAAERYAIGLKDAWEKAKGFIKDKLENLISEKIVEEHRADRTRNIVVRTSYSNITYKYVMLPVWISCFTYNGKVYQFIVNGQTGKVGGDYPISPWRVAIAVLIGIAIVALLWYITQ